MSRKTVRRLAMNRHLSRSALALALLFGGPGVAGAQPAGNPVLVPPRPPAATDVPYPEGGHGNATVVLVLVIEKDGSVRSAGVEGGEEPFASAATGAASRWR